MLAPFSCDSSTPPRLRPGAHHERGRMRTLLGSIHDDAPVAQCAAGASGVSRLAASAGQHSRLGVAGALRGGLSLVVGAVVVLSGDRPALALLDEELGPLGLEAVEHVVETVERAVVLERDILEVAR